MEPATSLWNPELSSEESGLVFHYIDLPDMGFRFTPGSLLRKQIKSQQEMSLIDKLDHNRLPAHLAIIMDGNGRWAKARGLDRSEGHREGVEAIRRVVKAASAASVQYLTLYAFST